MDPSPRALHAMLLGVLLCASRVAIAEPVDATEAAEPPSAAARDMRTEVIEVRGRGDSLVGVAETASVGSVGALQLERRPLSRPGEVLETVPGLIATQHSGAGKANQFFVRGFNLDHGTDFATSVDGVPVNLPSHGHGQGYTDLNFMIPELVERVDFRKGLYYADLGDFSSAGGADIRYFDVLPHRIAQAEGGMFGYGRGLLAGSEAVGPGHVLYGLEIFHNDGPWEHEDDFWKGNGVLRFSAGDEAFGGSVTASAYVGDWDATDQIAKRALALPGFDRFDSLNRTSGGDSQKYMLYGEWHRSSASSESEVLLYGFYQNLDLFSNFTYFLGSPDGDEFEQADERWVGGAKARHTLVGSLFGASMETTAGLQVRSDSVDNGLFQTVRRNRTEKVDHDGAAIPATTRSDDVFVTNVSPWLENRLQWNPKLRSIVGVRLDYAHFDVDGATGVVSGSENDVIVSPKGSLVIGPFADTELYLSAGMGFHSNDARGVVTRFDSADPLVRSYGAEVGLRTAIVPKLNTTVAFWWLDLDSELVFIGDAGTTEATRSSRRYGVEIANYYDPTPWLTLDVDAAFSHARFRDDEPEGDHVPGSIESVVAAGVSLHDLAGFFGALRLRYFGPRPLIEDDSERSGDTILLSARVGYELSDVWTLSAEVFNLLDRDDSEIDYFYASRLEGEPAGPDEGGFDDVHFHPVDPISFRAMLTARF